MGRPRKTKAAPEPAPAFSIGNFKVEISGSGLRCETTEQGLTISGPRGAKAVVSVCGDQRSTSNGIGAGSQFILLNPNCKVEISGSGLRCETTEQGLTISGPRGAKAVVSVSGDQRSASNGVGMGSQLIFLNPNDGDSLTKSRLQGMQIRNGDSIYIKALNHAFSMDHVTVNKLHSMLNGGANKSNVQKLIKRMVKDGFLTSNNKPNGRSVIRSQINEAKLFEIKKMLDGINSQQKTLPNFFKLSLDGTPKQVEQNFRNFIKEVRRWYYSKGVKANVSSILGRSKEVYTTPGRGTLYVEVTHNSDCVTFVIQARHGWLKGYLVDDVAYELKPDVKGQFYMPHPKHRELRFKGNHHKISGGSPGSLIIGLDKLRKSLKSIAESGSNLDPETVGIFTLYLCEAPKFQPVFNQLCKSLVCPADSRLDMNPDQSTMNDLLRNWSDLSTDIMSYIDCVHQGRLPELKNKQNMDSIEKYIYCVRILHLDAYNEGLFHLKGLTDPNIWEDKEIYGGVAAADKQQRLKFNKTEVRACNSVRKRYMSTGFSHENGDCHMKPVQDIQLVHSTKTVRQPQGLYRSQHCLLSRNKPVTMEPFCSFNSQMKFSKIINQAGLSLSLSSSPKLSDNRWFNSHVHKGLTNPNIWEEKEIFGGVVRMCRVSDRGEKLNYRDTDKRKQASFSKGGVAADKLQRLKFNKTEVRACSSVHKRYMSTGCSHQNGDCHMKLVQDIQLVHSKKTVQQPQGLSPSEPCLVSKIKPVTMQPFCSFNSQMKLSKVINQAVDAKGFSPSLSSTPKLLYSRWFNSHVHMPKHPICSSYKVKSNKVINQNVHADGLSPSFSTTLKLSNTSWFKRQVPMPNHEIFPVNTGIIGGMTRIIEQFKGKADGDPKTLLHRNIEMACPHNWTGSPKMRFPVRACRTILRILHK